MLQHGVEHFPRVALFWRLYAEHERATRGPEVAWKLLNENEEKALCWCRCDADLWRVAAECCRDAHPREERASESTELVGRTFERAVAAAGAAPEATELTLFKEIDPLTNGQLAAAVLKGDSVRSAHLFGEGGLPLEFVNF